MMLCLWSVKGGSGCTVTAAAVGLLGARQRETLLVDLGGDLALALGATAAECGPLPAAANGWGIAGWLTAPCPPPDALARFEQPIAESLALLPLGTPRQLSAVEPDGERLAILARLLADDGRLVVVDLGLAPSWWHQPLLDLAERSILVTRACYLALARAAVSELRPDAVVLVDEAGRALRASDVAESVGVPVVATVAIDPAVARAVDSGLLARRLPRPLASLRALVEPAGARG
jgi:hypothetical protein